MQRINRCSVKVVCAEIVRDRDPGGVLDAVVYDADRVNDLVALRVTGGYRCFCDGDRVDKFARNDIRAGDAAGVGQRCLIRKACYWNRLLLLYAGLYPAKHTMLGIGHLFSCEFDADMR